MPNAENFQERVARLQRAENVARRVLEVQKGASRRELRNAWRRACKKYHPDVHLAEAAPEELKRLFTRAHYAYQCLSEGKNCEKLLEMTERPMPEEQNDNEDASNRWKYFLEWRNKYF